MTTLPDFERIATEFIAQHKEYLKYDEVWVQCKLAAELKEAFQKGRSLGYRDGAGMSWPQDKWPRGNF